jgi:hypothetical protein
MDTINTFIAPLSPLQYWEGLVASIFRIIFAVAIMKGKALGRTIFTYGAVLLAIITIVLAKSNLIITVVGCAISLLVMYLFLFNRKANEYFTAVPAEVK